MNKTGAHQIENRENDVKLFEYPAGTGSVPGVAVEGLSDPDAGEEPKEDGKPSVLSADALQKEHEKLLNDETQRALSLGREQGRLAEREAHAATLQEFEQQRKQQYAALMEHFAQGQERYFAQVEPEAVKLALHVAARILRRETQMDPLLLTGAVRVALGQLSASTVVRLRVPAQDASLWREAMALVPNLNLKLEIVAVPEMRLGECELETELGSVDLGLRAQLAEIERGFFDRLPAQRAEVKTIPSGGDERGFSDE